MSPCGGKNHLIFGGSIFFSPNRATQTIFGMVLTLSTSARLTSASPNTHTCSAIGHHPTSPPPDLYNISALHRRDHERRQHQKSLDSSRVTTPDPVGDLPRICRHFHHGATCDFFSRAPRCLQPAHRPARRRVRTFPHSRGLTFQHDRPTGRQGRQPGHVS